MSAVMLDLETWGLRPGSAIRSVGAVAFDLTGRRGAKFSANVDLASCTAAGLTVDQATVDWWARQSPEARAALEHDQRPLHDVALAFGEWWKLVGGDEIWAHGASFDVPIWQAASEAVGVPAPWDYRAVRDTRTLYAVAGFDVRTVPPVGTSHRAIDDAEFQANCVSAAFAKLRSTIGGAA